MADNQAKLLNVRLSFPDIWKPKAVKEGDDPKYSASFLLDKKDHEDQLKTIKSVIWAMAVEVFGGSEKAKELLKKNKLHFCLHEGSEKDYDGYTEDNMFLSTSSSKRPHIIDRDKSPLVEDDRKPYGGCYVNAVVRFWVQNNNFGKRVNAELMGVQFVADGEAFGAPPFNPAEHFEDLDDGKKEAKSEKKAEKSAEPDPDDDEIPL